MPYSTKEVNISINHIYQAHIFLHIAFFLPFYFCPKYWSQLRVGYG